MSYRRSSIRSVLFSESSFIKALSAVVGAFVSSSIFYPLNIVRLKLQCDRNLVNDLNYNSSSQFTFLKVIHDMIKKHGVLSLYQGWTANSISLCIGSFIYFYLNNAFNNSINLILSTHHRAYNLINFDFSVDRYSLLPYIPFP